jgi:hypothetical protein
MTTKDLILILGFVLSQLGCIAPPHRPLPFKTSTQEGPQEKDPNKKEKVTDQKARDDSPVEPGQVKPSTIEDPKVESEIEKYPLAVPLPFSSLAKPLVPPVNSPNAIGRELIVYRLALAATLAFQKGKTVDQSLSEVKSLVAGMNAIFHRDLGIEFALISDDLEKKLMMTPSNSKIDMGPIPQPEVAGVFNDYISEMAGLSNYDIGHTLYYNPAVGGGEGSRSPCQESHRAFGFSFSFGSMVHEVGHQFDAYHSCYVEGGDTFRSSIMCHSRDEPDFFHQVSLEAIIKFSRMGDGKLCGIRKPVANTPPRPYLAFPDGITIPGQTPFALKGGAIDSEDQSNLTYNWQQIDTNNEKSIGKEDNENAAFRTFPPSAAGFVRYLPNLPDLVAGKPTPSEVLSKVSRSYNFSMVVRDNNKLAGGVDWINAKVNVDGSAGPFQITMPVAPVTWKVGKEETIKWDVAGTDKAPIQTTKVNILLSLDNGASFRLVAGNIPNSGSYNLVVPSLPTSTGKIMVQAVDNLFFAVSSLGTVTITK